MRRQGFVSQPGLIGDTGAGWWLGAQEVEILTGIMCSPQHKDPDES